MDRVPSSCYNNVPISERVWKLMAYSTLHIAQVLIIYFVETPIHPLLQFFHQSVRFTLLGFT